MPSLSRTDLDTMSAGHDPRRNKHSSEERGFDTVFKYNSS